MWLSYTDLKGLPQKSKLTLARRDDVSAGHRSIREQFAALFPCLPLFEEVSIAVLPGKTLFFDFYAAAFRTFIEVQGGQHTTYNPFFHVNKAAFHRQQFNDSIKVRFCKGNEFRLLAVLPNKVLTPGDFCVAQGQEGN